VYQVYPGVHGVHGVPGVWCTRYPERAGIEGSNEKM
jgi:hypothetical protein